MTSAPSCSLYLLHDAQSLRAMALSLVPRERQRQARTRPRADRIADRCLDGGSLMVSGIIGGTPAIALGMLGIPFFYVLAFFAAVGDVVPYADPTNPTSRS